MIVASLQVGCHLLSEKSGELCCCKDDLCNDDSLKNAPSPAAKCYVGQQKPDDREMKVRNWGCLAGFETICHVGFTLLRMLNKELFVLQTCAYLYFRTQFHAGFKRTPTWAQAKCKMHKLIINGSWLRMRYFRFASSKSTSTPRFTTQNVRSSPIQVAQQCAPDVKTCLSSKLRGSDGQLAKTWKCGFEGLQSCEHEVILGTMRYNC